MGLANPNSNQLLDAEHSWELHPRRPRGTHQAQHSASGSDPTGQHSGAFGGDLQHLPPLQRARELHNLPSRSLPSLQSLDILRQMGHHPLVPGAPDPSSQCEQQHPPQELYTWGWPHGFGIRPQPLATTTGQHHLGFSQGQGKHWFAINQQPFGNVPLRGTPSMVTDPWYHMSGARASATPAEQRGLHLQGRDRSSSQLEIRSDALGFRPKQAANRFDEQTLASAIPVPDHGNNGVSVSKPLPIREGRSGGSSTAYHSEFQNLTPDPVDAARQLRAKQAAAGWTEEEIQGQINLFNEQNPSVTAATSDAYQQHEPSDPQSQSASPAPSGGTQQSWDLSDVQYAPPFHETEEGQWLLYLILHNIPPGIISRIFDRSTIFVHGLTSVPFVNPLQTEQKNNEIICNYLQILLEGTRPTYKNVLSQIGSCDTVNAHDTVTAQHAVRIVDAILWNAEARSWMYDVELAYLVDLRMDAGRKVPMRYQYSDRLAMVYKLMNRWAEMDDKGVHVWLPEEIAVLKALEPPSDI